MESTPFLIGSPVYRMDMVCVAVLERFDKSSFHMFACICVSSAVHPVHSASDKGRSL